MIHTPTTVPTVRMVLFTMVVEKLPCVQALGKFSKMGESGGPRGLRPISALDFNELKAWITSGPRAKSVRRTRIT
jgi:hypothetical protein